MLQKKLSGNEQFCGQVLFPNCVAWLKKMEAKTLKDLKKNGEYNKYQRIVWFNIIVSENLVSVARVWSMFLLHNHFHTLSSYHNLLRTLMHLVGSY